MLDTYSDASACWKDILSDVTRSGEILPVIERFARENSSPAQIVFGTSGWRGEIGSDFTFHNVRIVATAIIEMFKENDPDVMKAMGVNGLDEVRQRGVIVGHDNRMLGREFAMEVIGLLQKEGIKTWYAGEATTPEFSAGIEMLNASCSINLTPSHNPANYGGFKFNPSDGGPAGTEITSKISGIANRLMESRAVVQTVRLERTDTVNLTSLYRDYLVRNGTIDLQRIRDFINTADCVICIDNVHGASRGRIQEIIGASDKIKYLRTNDDPLFGGVAPEPSDNNMRGILDALGRSKARFKLGVILDPDGDRIRHSDGNMLIPMNYFGAMAFHFLHAYKGIQGVVAKSVGTSNLVNAIADKKGVAVRETKVGFKNFRPYMLPESRERAIVAFEESDGISGYNHTLEKDALFGILLSIEMMAVTGKDLGAYLHDIMDEFGYYYPDRSGIEVDRSLAGSELKRRLEGIKSAYTVGTAVDVGDNRRTVKEVTTLDGTRLLFDDGSWLMIRPSGTEPKVRFYIEARTEQEKEAVFRTAEKITRDAIMSRQ